MHQINGYTSNSQLFFSNICLNVIYLNTNIDITCESNHYFQVYFVANSFSKKLSGSYMHSIECEKNMCILNNSFAFLSKVCFYIWNLLHKMTLIFDD